MPACLDSVSPDKANCASGQRLLVTNTTALHQRGAYQGLPSCFVLRQAKCNCDLSQGDWASCNPNFNAQLFFFSPKVNAYI